MARRINEHPDTPPRTVGNADDRLPTPRTSHEPEKPVAGEPRKPDPDARATAPAAEDSNRDHAVRPGDDAVVPGAGIIRADADAVPKESEPAPGSAGEARKNPNRRD